MKISISMSRVHIICISHAHDIISVLQASSYYVRHTVPNWENTKQISQRYIQEKWDKPWHLWSWQTEFFCEGQSHDKCHQKSNLVLFCDIKFDVTRSQLYVFTITYSLYAAGFHPWNVNKLLAAMVFIIVMKSLLSAILVLLLFHCITWSLNLMFSTDTKLEVLRSASYPRLPTVL